MGSRIRVFEPSTVYSVVIRCVDRQFLLKPDHDPRHPLLAGGCPVEAFDSDNDMTPDPSVINIVGAAAARAAELAPVQIHWLEANINHLQVGMSVTEEQLENIPDFFRDLLSSIAVKVNKKWGRDGHMWGGVYRATPCVDDPAAEQQLVYSVTNPVKDGLVDSALESPFFSTFRRMARGERLRFFRIDWEAYYEAGGCRKKSHRPKDYLRWMEIELAPLPGQEDWPDHKRQSWARAQVREVERATREDFRTTDRTAMGAKAQFRVDPRDRPRDPKHSGPQPVCHWSSQEARREYLRKWRETLREHRAASIDYRLGMWEREFPVGTFRPPLIKRYQSSCL